jgi:hypothetical protein
MADRKVLLRATCRSDLFRKRGLIESVTNVLQYSNSSVAGLHGAGYSSAVWGLLTFEMFSLAMCTLDLVYCIF